MIRYSAILRRFLLILLIGILAVAQLSPAVDGMGRVHAATVAHGSHNGNGNDNGNGNSGDIKIEGSPPETGGNNNDNDPHVCAPFFVQGFNMATQTGSITFESWPPTGNKSVVLTDSYNGTPDGQGTFQFQAGPYNNPPFTPGHYKVFVTDNNGGEKHKTF